MTRSLHNLIALILLPLASVAGASSPRPNIILVMADDLGWGDLAYNGNKVVQTPHLDAMSREAVRLDRFYAAAPVCSPTRGSCLTGRHPYRYGITWAGETPLKSDELTIAEVLRDAGYATGHFGKWHVGGLSKTLKQSYFPGPIDPANYSPPWENGFDECFSTESMVPTYNPTYHLGPDFGTDGYRHLQTVPVDRGQRQGGFRWQTSYWTGPGELVDEWLPGDDSELIMDHALDFIDKNRSKETPFLSLIWFHAVHTPLVASNEDRKPYSQLPIPAQHWFGATTAMDRQIGRLRKQLREWSIEKNTIVWFCSDNGPSYIHDFNSSGPYRGKKSELFEGGLRVPAIFEWPKLIKQAGLVDAPISTSDFYPTLLKAAGVKLPDQQPILDGMDVMKILTGEQKKRVTPIAFQAPVKSKKSYEAEVGSLQMALSGDQYKLITMDGGKKWLLFDLLKDPGETKDLSTRKPTIVKDMHRKLTEWTASCAESAEGKDYPIEPAPECTHKLDEQFDFLPDLPDSIGVAGPFVGTSNGALIVAGGANFENKPLVEGGQKVWHDRIFILEAGKTEWDTRFHLPSPRAYGASTSTSEGILLAGGSDSERDHSEVSLLQWDEEHKKVSFEDLPPLPLPMSGGRAVTIGTKVYVIPGGSSAHPKNNFKAMWALDLSAPDELKQWESLTPCPGPPRVNMSMVRQQWSGSDCLFLFAGVHEKEDSNGKVTRDFRTDCWRYDPNTDTWTDIAPLPAWNDPRTIPDKSRFEGQRASATAAAVVPVGERWIYSFSGTTGRFILLPDGTQRNFADRPLNPKRILRYDVTSDTWSEPGIMPVGALVTSAVQWNDRIVIPSGEIKPGIRTPRVPSIKLADLGSKHESK